MYVVKTAFKNELHNKTESFDGGSIGMGATVAQEQVEKYPEATLIVVSDTDTKELITRPISDCQCDDCVRMRGNAA